MFFIFIACGNRHAGALNENGELFLWGDGVNVSK
jgi:alpha-tubulin suppressor-like RCC1 family protein